MYTCHLHSLKPNKQVLVRNQFPGIPFLHPLTLSDLPNSAYVVLTSAESPNLKTLLKNLIKKVTSLAEDDEDDDLDQPARPSRHGPKLLNFDLGHVQEWRKKNQVSSVVVALQDSEAFDAGLLADVIDLFQ